MMRLLYSLLYTIAHVFILPQQYLKRRPDVRPRWLREKLGGGAGEPAGQKTLWVHAVSVGEAIAAATFVAAFKARHPNYKVIVSTVTDTGQAVAMQRLNAIARVIYLPFDLEAIFRRAIRRYRPTLFVNMETELWPNMFAALHAEAVPLVLLNGRISEKSFKGYGRIRFALGEMLGCVRLFCMQDEVYARRIISLGADEARVKVTGSLKFDIKVSDKNIPWIARFAEGARVIVAGSTHHGEDELIADAYARLCGQIENLKLVIAPRHPERADAVAGMLKARGLGFIRRSQLTDAINEPVVLLDTVGELSAVYKHAEAVIIGGSFIEHGGQNPLEPAYWGKAVLCGPSMGNFPFVREFYERGAMLRTDRDRLYDDLKGLMMDAHGRDELGRKARELMLVNQGATARALDEIERCVGV